jgi:lipid-A-disaccharide synthase-like uncharacterized protein
MKSYSYGFDLLFLPLGLKQSVQARWYLKGLFCTAIKSCRWFCQLIGFYSAPQRYVLQKWFWCVQHFSNRLEWLCLDLKIQLISKTDGS